MTKWPRLLLLSVLMAGSVGCDQATKAFATATLGSGPSLSYFGDTVRLMYAENRGGFLSVGADLPPAVRSWLFGLLPGVVVAVLLVPLIRNPGLRRMEVIALGLIVSGALGNLIDRVLLGVVRDFLNVGIGPLRTGIFNVADLAVTLGALTFCVSAAQDTRRAEGRAHPPPVKLRRTSRSGANPPVGALAPRSLGEGGSDGVGESEGRSPSPRV